MGAFDHLYPAGKQQSIEPISEDDLTNYKSDAINPGPVRLSTSDVAPTTTKPRQSAFSHLYPEPRPEGKHDPITGFKSGLVGMGEGIMQTVSGLNKAGADVVREHVLPDFMKDSISGTSPSESAQAISSRMAEIGEDINFQPSVSAQDLFKSPVSFVTKAPTAIIEYGPASLPYLLASMLGPVGMTVNGMAITGGIAKERAAAKGESTPSAETVLESVPFGVASAVLDRLGAKGILSAGLGKFAARVARGTAGEAVTEGTQSGIEQAGSIIGTPKELDPVRFAQEAGLEATVGGGVGGFATGAKEIISPTQPPAPSPPTGPTRDDLAATLEDEGATLPEPEQYGPPAPEQEITPPPPVNQEFTPQAISNIAVGDIIEQASEHTGQVVSGKVQQVGDTESGKYYHVVSDDGALNTVFDADGPVSVLQPAATMLDQAAPVEPLGPPTFKEAVKLMSDDELMKHYTGKNIRNRNLADQELNERYPDRNITKNIDVMEAEDKVDTAPTDAQKEAGNYRKGLVSISGLPVSIENPAGSIRSGKDADGNAWEVTMPTSYGYFKGTKGADGDHIDVFVGQDHSADNVYIVDQIDFNGKFDEHKVLISFPDFDTAMDNYERSFSDNRGEYRVGAITTMTMAEFKEWLKKGKTKEPVGFVPEKFGPPAPEKDIPFDDVSEIVSHETSEEPEASVPEVVQDDLLSPQPPPAPEPDGTETEQESAQGQDTETVEETQAEQAEPAQPEESDVSDTSVVETPVGKVGMMLGEGDVVLTTTGRKTTPFPKIGLGTPRKASNTSKRVERWLMENAKLEAKARTDRFNLRQFVANYDNPSQADKDSAEYYLFDPDFKNLHEQASDTTQDKTEPAAEESVAQEPEAEQEPEKPEPPAKPEDGDGRIKDEQNQDVTDAGKDDKKAPGRGKKLQDVGEKMEGKRAFNKDMEGKTVSEQAKIIIKNTKKKEAFNIEKRDGQTDGTARFAQALLNEIQDFSGYLYKKGITKKGSRGRYGSKMPGWEEQVKLFFDDNLEKDWGNAVIGSWRFTQEQVEESRSRIVGAAEDYIELGSRINDILDNARTVEELKIELKEALQDDDFERMIDKFKKNWRLERDIFSDSSYTAFGKITDETEIKKTTRATPMVRPKLDKIERQDLKDYRLGMDVTPELFQKIFGFRGVEFGEWVSASEGQAHINHAYDALMDLSTKLNIDAKHISLGGKLGFAFGSRGSGTHAAHFESDTNVINLTKTKGDGTVAHEWLHALDHALTNSDMESKEAVSAMYKKLRIKLKPLEAMEKTVKGFLSGSTYYPGSKSKGPVGMAKMYLGYVKSNPSYHMGRKTDFKREADKLGKDYWGNNKELLARAWEAYIYDTLEGSSPYLVSDWVSEAAVTKDAGYRGTPYPVGEERTEFNEFFDEFLKLIEFSDKGVKLKAGSLASVANEFDVIKAEADRILDALPQMMKEYQDEQRVQQDKVSPSVSGGDGRTSAEDVQGIDSGEVVEGPDGRGGETSEDDVRADSGETTEGAGDGSGSGVDSVGDSVSRNDTVSTVDKDATPPFQAQGKNHVISVGALAETRSQKEKARDNIKIITLVKQIEGENRAATPEEQSLLAKYTGWGSVKDAFKNAKGSVKDGWQEIHDDLKNLLTEKEYKEARRSIQYGHYTSEIVVRSMWKAIQRFGVKKGNIFEPGMGVGNFPGMMPSDLNLEYSGIEIDTMTARISKILYPESSVRHSDFIDARYSDGTFDAAIGNPPFSSSIIRSDPKYRKKALSLHNYFFAKTIDMVAPGGVIAFVTSTGTMDNIDSSARKMMGDEVDLVGAIRLPNTAFKTSSHTEVVTDIIFLRKRLPGEDSNGVKWTGTKDIHILKEDGTPNVMNEYFVDNPEMVLGDLAEGGMYRKGEFTVNPVANHNLTQQLDEAIERLPDKIITDIKKSEAPKVEYDPQQTKDGSFYVSKEGVLMQVHDGVGVPVPLRGKGVGGITKKQETQIKLLIPIRDSLQKSLNAMVARDDAAMKKHQKDLKKFYDFFVKKYGPVTKSETISRKPSMGKVEEARNEMRDDFRAEDREFNEGTIDLSMLLGKINPDTGKKYTVSQIAKIRSDRRKTIEESGDVVDEGDFNPSDVPDTTTIKYSNLEAIKTDPSFYDFMILESYDEDTGKATTRDVFEKNIVAEVKKPEIKTAVDAMLYSLATFNKIDLDVMSKELGTHPDAIAEELEQLDLIYMTPNQDGGFSYTYAEEYLSGRVKDKLLYAQTIAKNDKRFQRNVDALEAVQPADIPPSNINTQLGAPYLTPAVIESFMTKELNITVGVIHSEIVNAWEVKAHDAYAAENTTQYGTDKKPASDIMQNLLSRKTIQVTMADPEDSSGKKRIVDVAATELAQQKGRDMQERFSKWVWESEHSTEIHRKYNKEYNNTVPRKYDGKHITTAITPSITLKAHQKAAIWRIIQSGNTYMAHAVGAGKTLAMVASGMEMRRLGQWKKPLYVVPNHMLAQFSGEFRWAYPQAKIYVADENNFHADRRKSFVANVAGHDWDGVVMTYSSFKKIPLSPDFEAKMIEVELDKFRMAMEEAAQQGGGGRGTTAARIEKNIEALEKKLKTLKGSDKDDSFTFEQLGTDAIILDEAHYFRKLSFQTNQGNLKGITPTGSQAAWDLYAKSKFLDTIHPGRNLVMASGTPVTNTLAEIYTLQRFMDERSLEERGLSTFDAWSSTFTTSVTAAERQPSGNYKNVTRLARIENVGVLSQHTREFMDTVTSDQLGSLVDRPTMKTGGMIMRTVKPTKEYLAYKQYLAHRTEEIANRNGPAAKGDDILLSVITDGIMAAIDMRMIDPTLPEQDSKLEDTISQTLKIWKETSEDEFTVRHGDKKKAPLKGGVQLIFSDVGVNGKTKDGKTFSAYAHIKRKLIQGGVPASQIAFISEYETSEEKRRLSLMMNAGEIRILIGSTIKMGTGLNVQNRLKAIHNLDVRWLPADLEQRIGRGLRQGNQYKEVEIYGYGTEGSYDSTMWGLLETKGKFINEFLEGNADLTSVEDIENTDQFAIAKAMTSGDAREITKMELQGEVSKLARKSSNFRDEQIKIKSKIGKNKAGIEYNEEQIKQLDEAIKIRTVPPEGEFVMTVSGEPYTERAEAAKALEEAVDGVINTKTDTPADGVTIGKLNGFDVQFFATKTEFHDDNWKKVEGWQYELFFNHPAFDNEGKKWNSIKGGFNGSGAITVMNNTLNRAEKRKDDAVESIERSKRDIGVLESQIADRFPQEKELEEKREALAAVEKDLQENAPVVVVYDEYPVEYWQKNKEAIKSAMFSIESEEEFSFRISNAKRQEQKIDSDLEDKINKSLKRSGFDRANLKLFTDPQRTGVPGMDDRAQGAYYKGVIYLSLYNGDILSVLDHEKIHALRAAGAFLDSEWSLLEEKANAWRVKYDIDKIYADQNLSEEKLNEEAVARAFQDHKVQGPVRRIINRVLKFLKNIKATLNGANLFTAEDVFDAVAGGKIRGDLTGSDIKLRDEVLFSLKSKLSKNKNKALDEATETLDEHLANKLGVELRPSLGKVASYVLHPRQIAALHKAFTPVYHAAVAMMKMRDVLVHKMTTRIEIYNRLKKDAKKRVNAVLEMGRLNGENYEAGRDGKITVTNEGHKDALHIKVGETVTLNKVEVEAYNGVRAAMDLGLDTYIDVELQEAGYKELGINNRQDLEEAVRKETDKRKQDKMLRTIQNIKDIEAAKRKGYIPLKRWGEIGIVVRSKDVAEGEDKGDLVWFERVEIPKIVGRKNTIGDNKPVQDAIAKLRKKFPNADYQIDPFEMKDFTNVKANLNINDLDVLAASSDMSQEDYNNLREMLADAHKRRGFRAHFFKSNNVAGYDADFERALNDYVVSISGHLARRTHTPKIEEKIHKIDEAGLNSLHEYSRKYLDYITDPQEEFGAIRGMAFNWYIAGNIASGVTNAAQPFMVTAPWLKSMFSHAQITKHMLGAYKDVMATMNPKKMGEHIFDLSALPDDIRDAAEKANAEGYFLPLNTLEAGQIANANSAELRGMHRKVQEGMDILSLTFSIPERINRLVTFLAAHRLAMEPESHKKIMAFAGRDQNARYMLAGRKGGDFAEQFADYAVMSTQFHMGKMNRPTLARGVGTVPTQFMSFTAQALELQYRMAKVHGADSGKALGLMLLTVVAMSGIKGFPFADDLEELFEKAWQTLTRTDLDVDTEMKALLDKYVGKAMSEMIMKGIPAAFFGVDMSGRWGFGNITPDNQSDLFGVSYNMIVERPMQAFTDLARGDVLQAIADVSPAIARNALQSYIWAEKGVRSGRSGDTVIAPEDLEKSDIGFKFLGFTSSRITAKRERIYAGQRADRAVNNLRSDYYDKLARSYAAMNKLSDTDKDMAAAYESKIEAILAEIQSHNERVPTYKMIIINPTSLKRRIAEEMIGAKANKPRKQARGRAQELDEIYGE